MICEHCGKNEATTVLKQTINGESRTLHLCSGCANSMMFGNFFSDFGINSLFSKNMSQPSSGTRVRKVCDRCKTSLEEILETGKIGCAHCYETFSQDLARSIEKIHGKSVHTGTVPKSAKGTIKVKNLLTEYKMELNRLIAQQEFEKAAELRDKIKQLEQGEEKHD